MVGLYIYTFTYRNGTFKCIDRLYTLGKTMTTTKNRCATCRFSFGGKPEKNCPIMTIDREFGKFAPTFTAVIGCKYFTPRVEASI